MTTAQNLIQAAYREGNLISIGTVPTTNELAEALDRLNAVIKSVYGEEMGENFADWPVPLPQHTAPIAANAPQLPYPQGNDVSLYGSTLLSATSNAFTPYPPKNSRVVWGGVTTTVYFPEAPDDGSRMSVVQGSGAGDSGAPGQVLTLDGNGRTIQTAKTQVLTDPVSPAEWLYRADIGDWVLIATLALTDTPPFPSSFDDLWVSFLAIRLAPRYGKTTSPETAATYKRMLGKLKSRYRQAGITIYKSGDIPDSFQSYSNNRWWP